MTVSELIAHLAQFPADAPVYVRGYESGAHELQPTWCGVVRMVVGFDKDVTYGGPDKVIENDWPDEEEIRESGCNVIDAVFLDRKEIKQGDSE